jgi:cysteine desulfurase
MISGGFSADRWKKKMNIRFVGLHAQGILQSVQPLLAASTGSACTSGIPEPSHVLRAIGFSEEEAEGCIRFSIGRFTTESDIDQTVSILSRVTDDLAQIKAQRQHYNLLESVSLYTN